MEALLYGRRLLNFDAELVDRLRDTVFREAAHEGKPRGRVRLFEGDVRVATKDGESVKISLWNQGEGFPPGDAQRLFESFFRVRDKSTHAKRGSGIGLFTVQHIAELHDGQVWAESEQGAWAAFHLRFPAEPPKAQAPAAS